MIKLDAKAKAEIKKDRFTTCGYIYTDGIVIRWQERHTYKGEEFRKQRASIIEGKVPISMHNANGEGPFVGRIVVHNATLLLDGIQGVDVYRNGGSEKMKEMNLRCDSITLLTGSGIRIHESIFHFLSSDFHIQNEKALSVKTDWPETEV